MAILRRRLRPFIVWLLVLALPLHAAVVAAMAHDGNGGAMQVVLDGNLDAATPAPAGAASSGLDIDADEASAAIGEASSGADGDAASAAGDPAGHDHDPHTAKRCGVPASCCLWIACLPPPMLVPDAVTVPAPAAAPAGPVAFLTDGPLRPPRTPVV